jgi:hypothetical protein
MTLIEPPKTKNGSSPDPSVLLIKRAPRNTRYIWLDDSLRTRILRAIRLSARQCRSVPISAASARMRSSRRLAMADQASMVIMHTAVPCSGSGALLTTANT